MKKPSVPSPSDETELFLQAMEGVVPITPSDRIPPVLSPPRLRSPQNSKHAALPVLDSFSDHGANEIPDIAFLRAGMNKMTLRKLRRGFWTIQDTIDLHGYTTEEARKLLQAFLRHAVHQGFRCINIIHGKGWRAEGGEGLLKIRVRHWLPQNNHVLAFCEPPANAGGGGAVWVLLKTAIV